MNQLGMKAFCIVNFNSTIVRLKHPAEIWEALSEYNFNSTIVRLKLEDSAVPSPPVAVISILQ